jgi:hypothetical protein
MYKRPGSKAGAIFILASLALGLTPFVAKALESAPRVAAEAELQPSLSQYLEMLAHPESAWSGRTPSALRLSAPHLSAPQVRVRQELESMITDYAPRIWWHSKDPYPPMDPLDFIAKSSLRYRTTLGRERVLYPAGSVSPEKLSQVGGGQMSARPYQTGFAFNGSGYYLKYEESSHGARHLAQAKFGRNVPILWRMSQGAFARALSQGTENRKQVLIEYWYHVPYNLATGVGIGNHQGDWEGMAMLVELGIQDGKLSHHLLATYFAEHESGTWLCENEVQRTPDLMHPVAYSAMGTHATYATDGKHHTPVITDVTEKGMSWDSWKMVRPLALEPYYGFTGAWGEPRYFSFMTGPLVPGPGFKSQPRDRPERDVFRTLATLHSHCKMSQGQVFQGNTL